MGFLYYTLLTLLIIVALLLVMLILIQKGRGGGLSGAFGGGGGSAAFGAKTGDVLTWLTSSFFAVFIILAVCLDLVVNHQYHLATAAAPTAVTSTAGQTAPTALTNTPLDTTPSTPPKQDVTPVTTPPVTTPAVNTPAMTTPATPAPASVPTTGAAAAVNGVLNHAGNQFNAATQKATDVAKSATQPK